MRLSEYEESILQTDLLSKDELKPILFGLYGEVGSVMAAVKKNYREGAAFAGFGTTVVEELGDTLWYFSALCRRLGYSLESVFGGVTDDGHNNTHGIAARNLSEYPLAKVSSVESLKPLDDILLVLGSATSALFEVSASDDRTKELLCTFAELYLQAIQGASVSFADVVQTNVSKVRGRFVPTDLENLPDFDYSFPDDERLPNKFEIKFIQRKSGQICMSWNGVFIGAPLTDNISEKDNYRFHDVFHLSHAAVMHWSPVFRALIQHKRKSKPEFDHNQDGGRAIAVEEGLTAWVFARSKDLDYFEEQRLLSFELLRGVQDFVRGFEVEVCPLNLWEKAILDGYSVFRQLREKNGGIVIGDRTNRTISYRCSGDD